MSKDVCHQQTVSQYEKLLKQYLAAGIFRHFDVQEQQFWFELIDFTADALKKLLLDDSCPF